MAKSGGDLRWAASWNVETLATGAVVVHAGPDRSFDLSGLDQPTVQRLTGWANDDAPITPATPREERLADRLLDIGALLPSVPDRIAVVGDDALAQALEARGVSLVDSEPDLTVIVRGENGWPSATTPHLAVDARYHHTIVIGPYVIPGRSTCTTCLDGRIKRRWGRLPDPVEPAASTRPVLLAELLTIQLDLIQQGISPLINATISWDLEQGRTEHTTVLKVPGCAVCETSRPDGRLELPTP